LGGVVINGYNAAAGADQTSGYVGTTLNTPLSNLKVGASYDYAGIKTQPLSGPAYANATAVSNKEVSKAKENGECRY